MLEQFKYLVLQAGGTKCAWQAGFLAALDAEGSFRPEAISAVSASSAVACAMVCRRLEFAVDCFKAAMAMNRKNIYLSNLLKKRRVFPHAVIYREGLLRAFDQRAMETLCTGPDIKILVTRPSPKLPGYGGMTIGLSLCAFRRLVKHRWYRQVEERFGFCREFISVKQCATPSQLADLVLASSCTPPITPWYCLHGRPVLDGGLIEDIPLSGLPQRSGPTLVLLTTQRITIKTSPDVVYVEPSEKLRISSWDYTDPKQIDNVYELGKKDGWTFVRLIGKSPNPESMAAKLQM
jgi:predicted acylesterase/phospholipase RssA